MHDMQPRRTCWNALLAALLIGVAWPAAAQDAANGGYDATNDDAATLIADRVNVTANNTLIADGGVQIFYQQNLLTASRVIYDQNTDTVEIQGPLRLVQPGQTGAVVVADSGKLSRDLQNGVLVGARMVMARELQIAANQIERKNGETTIMDRVVASSCQICASDPTPLWEIRARQITHSMEDRQLRFKDAQFRFMGVPLMWLPSMRLPDPTVERYQGFLAPEFRTTSNLGPGIKTPYFFPLGESADLTLTPYLATNHTKTLGGRYRQALTNGAYTIEGSASRDGIRPGKTRAYIFARGAFSMADDYNLGAQLRMVSDASYLVDYGISDDDRLWSGLWLQRVRSDQMVWMRAGHTHSIREGESNKTQPMTSIDFVWTRVIRPAIIGGETTLTWETHEHRRSSDLSYDTATDPDTISDGRDVLRSSVTADWRRNWITDPGIVVTGLANVSVDAAIVRQDVSYSKNTVRALPTVGVEFRWPWVNDTGAASHVIEPIAQILVSPNHLKKIPNEDSVLPEFDEGNLFSLSRFPGGDRRETGTRANLGVTWTRVDAKGWSLGTTVGRIVRMNSKDQFPDGSGLNGTYSDWLVGTTYTGTNGLTISNRALFDDKMDFSRDELRVGYLNGRSTISAGYIWMKANPDAGEDDATSQMIMEVRWAWNDVWATRVSNRYDFTAQRAATAGIGMEYRNECMSVDVYLSRRYTSSTSVTPETSLGVAVQLAGFGAGSATGKSGQVCRG